MNAILFVDDHEVLARFSCKILQMNGYHAEYAYNANDALAMFACEKFDLLVTDYRTEGMNGLELAKHELVARAGMAREPDFYPAHGRSVVLR